MFEIPLIRPYISEEMKHKVIDVLDSYHLTEGKVTGELEDAVKYYIGVKHCIAVTSCTTGLELALRCLNIGVGDEVVVPAFTYPATADVVRIVGAVPVFVDIDPDTMLVNYDHLGKVITPATKAMIPVSLFGNPLDYDRLNQIKEQFGLFIVEDAACALSAEFKGVPTGRHADITVFSLHPRKFVTTGEGGLITTDNNGWAAWIRSYKRFGIAIDEKEIIFTNIGTNCKLSDILAAVGVTQMQQIQDLISQRQNQASYYMKLLKDVPGVKLPLTTAYGKHSYQSFCIFVPHRNAILKQMRSRGIEVQIGSYFLPEQPAFHDSSTDRFTENMDGSRRADSQCLALPLYHQMTKADQEKVISILKETIAGISK
jgi:dTDP-4-amino-4,6-dideoxygalactose transaminase